MWQIRVPNFETQNEDALTTKKTLELAFLIKQFQDLCFMNVYNCS